MSAIWAIARRELAAFFGSPIGWISLFIFVFIEGIFFTAMFWGYYDYSQQVAMSPWGADQLDVNSMLIQPFFGNLWVIALFLVPALTMRLIAEDRRQRSIELLLTSPITSFEIVLGKFIGLAGFAALMLVGTAHLAGLVVWLGEPDANVLTTNYLASFLVITTFMAGGLFASSLTENQIVALVLSFGINLFLWIIGWLVMGSDDGAVKTVVEFIAVSGHAERLGQGVIHLKDVTYFLSFIVFFLFATVQRVEALRWR